MLSIRVDFVIMSKETTGVEARLKITELFVELPFKLSPVVKLPHYTVSAFSSKVLQSCNIHPVSSMKHNQLH